MFREPYSSRKNGRFGNLSQGTVAPGQKVKARQERSDQPNHSMQSVGVGDKIANVTYDPRTRTMVATKVISTYGIALGTVYQSSLKTWGGGLSDRWDLSLLPVAFVDGDVPPALPDGIGWIKLLPGSAQVGSASPLAGESLEDLLSSSQAATNSHPPRLQYAFFDAANLSYVYLVFDANVQGFYPEKSSDAQSLLLIDTTLAQADGLQPVSFEIDPEYNNVVRLYLSRAVYVEYNEEVGITLGAGFIKGASRYSQPQDRVVAFYRYAKNQYTLAVNEGEEIAADTTTVVTRYLYLHDKAQAPDYATSIQRFSSVVPAGGGGGGSSSILVSVLGGNRINSDVAVGEDSTGTVSFPVPVTDEAGQPTAQILPEVEDWTKLLIPNDYVIGDPLKVMPDGLCVARLERPYSFDGRSWDASIAPFVVIESEGPVLFAEAVADLEVDDREIKVYFNRRLHTVYTAALATVKNTADNTVNPVLSLQIDQNIVTFKVRDELSELGSYEITIQEGKFRTLTSEKPIRLSPLVSSQPVRLLGDAFSVVYAINRKSYQMFYPGDLITAVDEGTVITDSKGLSVKVLDLISNASNVRSPHTHSNPRYDGSGSAGPALAL